VRDGKGVDGRDTRPCVSMQSVTPKQGIRGDGLDKGKWEVAGGCRAALVPQ
jgi:hypothetical protein